MKKSIILILSLLFTKLFAVDAVVIAFKAPLLKAPDSHAKVLQWVTKGTSLYIHQQGLPPDPLKSRYQSELPSREDEYYWKEGFSTFIPAPHRDFETKNLVLPPADPPLPKKVLEQAELLKRSERKLLDEEIIERKKYFSTKDQFYETFDRNGNSVFIDKRFVKVVFNDEREMEQAPSQKNDPTDYRPAEPLRPTYPFRGKTTSRTMLQTLLSPREETHYNYNSPIKENGLPRFGFSIRILKQMDFKFSDRFYSGISLSSSMQSTLFKETTSLSSKEQFLRGEVGPIVSYDNFLTETWRGTLSLILPINYSQISVLQNDTDSQLSEKRNFAGFSLDPILSSAFSYNISENIGITLEGSLQFYLQKEFLPSAPPTAPALWNLEKDSVSRSAFINPSLLLGIMAEY